MKDQFRAQARVGVLVCLGMFRALLPIISLEKTR